MFNIKKALIKLYQKVKTIKNMGGHARVPIPNKPQKDNEVKVDGMLVPIPKSSNIEKESVKTYKGASDKATALFITHSVQNIEKTFYEEEPYDDVLDPTPSPITVDTKPTLPDGWAAAYYPAGGETGKKPHIPSIKEWVNNVKLNDMTTEDLQFEYGKVFNKAVPTTWNKKMRDDVVDSIAFMVARKIWYVGRRPSSMTDSEWDEQTKNMRPHEGSFSKNEHWSGGFPYGQEYTYRSWGHEEVMELKNIGKLNW